MLRLCFLFFYCYGHHPDLHSFPTRRSSDLAAFGRSDVDDGRVAIPGELVSDRMGVAHADARHGVKELLEPVRSEEHTSELQSLTNLVCRLLLEKKKTNNRNIYVLNEIIIIY